LEGKNTRLCGELEVRQQRELLLALRVIDRHVGMASFYTSSVELYCAARELRNMHSALICNVEDFSAIAICALSYSVALSQRKPLFSTMEM